MIFSGIPDMEDNTSNGIKTSMSVKSQEWEVQSFAEISVNSNYIFSVFPDLLYCVGDEGLPAVPGGGDPPHHGRHHHVHLAGLRPILQGHTGPQTIRKF